MQFGKTSCRVLISDVKHVTTTTGGEKTFQRWDVELRHSVIHGPSEEKIFCEVSHCKMSLGYAVIPSLDCYPVVQTENDQDQTDRL